MSKVTHALNTVEISPEKIHAVIFDMDGVVTKTANIHSIAWKTMFDNFLKKYADEHQTNFVPFDSHFDYNQYVDGKPRSEGIQAFLKSRDVDLPLGYADDSSDSKTIHGLGNLKNDYFLDYIKVHGVEPFETTVSLIQQLKENGIKVGIISSSKNCKTILQSANVLSLFEVRIDGVYSEQHRIKGKPEPDVFLEAAKQMGVLPENCIVVEDAISGVQAGSKGGFALVIGVDRVGQEEALYKNGADVVIKDLVQVHITPLAAKKDAIEAIDEIIHCITGKKPVFFIDYDGTLAPIAPTPDLAHLPDDMKKTLLELSKKFTVAVISGRDLQNVKKFIQIDNLYYSGSHGFDIEGPKGEKFYIEDADKFASSIDAAEKELRQKLESIKGIIIERKKFGIAIHYRLVDDRNIDEITRVFEDVQHKYIDLRKTYGKKVLELQPKIDWNKGKALLWLLKCLNLNDQNIVPFYLGDDYTDEDAFKVIIKQGIGICVQESLQTTYARYTLKDPEHVKIFLQKMMELFSKSPK